MATTGKLQSLNFQCSPFMLAEVFLLCNKTTKWNVSKKKKRSLQNRLQICFSWFLCINSLYFHKQQITWYTAQLWYLISTLSFEEPEYFFFLCLHFYKKSKKKLYFQHSTQGLHEV